MSVARCTIFLTRCNSNTWGRFGLAILSTMIMLLAAEKAGADKDVLIKGFVLRSLARFISLLPRTYAKIQIALCAGARIYNYADLIFGESTRKRQTY
jgi:hypothetical protein